MNLYQSNPFLDLAQVLPPDLLAKVDAAKASVAAKMQDHKFAVLQFSGGKDSLACLELIRPWWGKTVVIWTNSGDAFPEVVDQMMKIKAQVPNFHMVRGSADLDQMTLGWPVDMLPQSSTAFGQIIDPDVFTPKLRLRYECCASNLWAPMTRAIRQLGATLVIRGQRNSERLRNTACLDGTVGEGVTYSLPIQEWTEQDVFRYLEVHDIELPRSYDHDLPSMDCMHCTAYLHEKVKVIPFMRERYPHQAIELEKRMKIIRDAQLREIEYLDVALAHGPAYQEEL